MIVRHAVSTSTFLSLFAVFGKLDPRHITNGVTPSSPAALRRNGANGISHDGPSAVMAASLPPALLSGEPAESLRLGVDSKLALEVEYLLDSD